MLRAESSSIREAIELIKQAKKPIILAGHGIVESGAEREVLAFAESQQIPIATTLLGLGCIPGGASAAARHDGHARRELGE
jgi:acetolactate synthase-1/2/3 large subunit